MNLSSPLFWLILLFLVILVWFDGLAAGKSTSGDAQPAKPSLWEKSGRYFKSMIKNPTPGTVLGLFILLLILRLLVGLLPLLAFLIAAWVVK